TPLLGPVHFFIAFVAVIACNDCNEGNDRGRLGSGTAFAPSRPRRLGGPLMDRDEFYRRSRPWRRVRHRLTGQEGTLVPAPRGMTVELGKEWVNLGKGPEEVLIDLLEIVEGPEDDADSD